MSNKKDSTIRIVRGEDRFAGSSNTDIQVNVDLKGERKNIIESEVNEILNLEEQFDKERQSSTKFRIAGKITNVFNNVISGQTNYNPFKNSLFYIDSLSSVSTNSPWKGYPQFDEFTFYRTRGIEGHIPFVNKSASTYNWGVYVSYPFKNKTDQLLKHKVIYESGTSVNNFVVTDGVPYYIKNRTYNGKNLITFYCGFKHNLSEGDWVETKFEIQGKKYFEVYSLGDDSYGNEDTVFSIFNYGYQDPLFGDFATGNVKRIIDINNKSETTSSYYVKIHKILTKNSNSDITKLGFERNPFPIKKQLEYSAMTPNNVQRVSIKDGNMTVGFSFDKDIDISEIKDNLDRPISDLFVTIVNKGYMGWFNNPYLYSNTNTGLQVGWDLNFLEDEIDDWWSTSNPSNRDTIPVGNYEFNNQVFFYNKSLDIGSELMGSICEFNDYEQMETELSEISHKISYNPQIFDNNSPNTMPDGYVYKPHYRVPVRVYSDYIEVGEKDKVDLIPDYSFLSNYNNEWRWRDLYPYGFVDSSGNGLNIPFLNGCHYPFSKILFLLSPLKKDINNYSNVIFAPITDDCE
jgi:hypothetical protein